MLTRKLWHALHTPPLKHPLYRHTLLLPTAPMPWYVGCLGIIVFPFLVIPGIILLSTAYSLRWAMNIAWTLAYQRETGMYDLVSLSPVGAIGVNWAIAVASITRNRTFEQLLSPGTWLFRFAILFVVFMTLTDIMDTGTADNSLRGLGLALIAAGLVTALFIDHFQSIILGVLTGILAAADNRTRLNASAAAFGGYLFLQVMLYTLTILLGFTVLGGIYNQLGWRGLGADVSRILLQLGIFFALREAVILILWRQITERLNAAPDEWDFSTAHLSGL